MDHPKATPTILNTLKQRHPTETKAGDKDGTMAQPTQGWGTLRGTQAPITKPKYPTGPEQFTTRVFRELRTEYLVED